MSEKKPLVERAREAGQLLIVAGTLAGAMGAASVKAWGWATSGPVALTKAQRLEKDVRRLKRQSRFAVRILEKLGKEKYDWSREEAAIQHDEESPE